MRPLLIDSENEEAQSIVRTSRPADDLSVRIGIGGNVRELGHATEKPHRQDLSFALDEVRDRLRKSRKMLVSPIYH